MGEPGPRWAPISLDPTATRIEVLKGITYMLAFMTSLRIARNRRGAAFLSEAIIVTGLVLAVAALLHPAFGTHKLYGVWEPQSSYAGRWHHLAPLLNPNNLAGYINVALCLALASSFSPRPRVPRPILAAVVTVLVATQVWVASRGGVLTMILGAAIVVAILRMGHMRRRRGAAVISLLAGVIAIAGVVMFVLANSDQAALELLDTGSSKPELFREALRMVPVYPIWGIGRGAFESAFPAFRETGGYWTATHPENFIVQWVTEWGVPVGFAGLLAIGFSLRPDTALARSSTAAGAWAAIAALTVQNLADLGSEVPGLVVAPVVCAAIVVGGSSGLPTRFRAEKWAQVPRAMTMTTAVLAACALLTAAAGTPYELNVDQRRLHDLAIEQQADVYDVEAAAVAAMLRHPAEPYFPFIAAFRLAADQRRSPMRWVDATLERSRIHGPAHLVLARWIARRSPSQTRLEYRLAMEQAPDLADIVMAEAPRFVGGYDDALELTPSGDLGRGVLRTLATVLDARLPATSVRLDEELALRAPSDAKPWLDAARNAVADLDTGGGTPWCAGAARRLCQRKAIALSDRAEKVAPRECEGYVLRARAYGAGGDAKRGLDELSAATDAVDERVACLQQLVDLADTAGDPQRAEEALGKITNAPCTVDAECARSLSWVATMEERRGNTRRALALYKRAHELEPDAAEFLLSVATVAARLGLHAEAADCYEQLAAKNPSDASWHQTAVQQRNAARGSAAAHF
jgi:O-antigen ligase